MVRIAIITWYIDRLLVSNGAAIFKIRVCVSTLNVGLIQTAPPTNKNFMPSFLGAQAMMVTLHLKTYRYKAPYLKSNINFLAPVL